jgi:hypothetical protein
MQAEFGRVPLMLSLVICCAIREGGAKTTS